MSFAGGAVVGVLPDAAPAHARAGEGEEDAWRMARALQAALERAEAAARWEAAERLAEGVRRGTESAARWATRVWGDGEAWEAWVQTVGALVAVAEWAPIAEEGGEDGVDKVVFWVGAVVGGGVEGAEGRGVGSEGGGARGKVRRSALLAVCEALERWWDTQSVRGEEEGEEVVAALCGVVERCWAAAGALGRASARRLHVRLLQSVLGRERGGAAGRLVGRVGDAEECVVRAVGKWRATEGGAGSVEAVEGVLEGVLLLRGGAGEGVVELLDALQDDGRLLQDGPVGAWMRAAEERALESAAAELVQRGVERVLCSPRNALLMGMLRRACERSGSWRGAPETLQSLVAARCCERLDHCRSVQAHVFDLLGPILALRVLAHFRAQLPDDTAQRACQSLLLAAFRDAGHEADPDEDEAVRAARRTACETAVLYAPLFCIGAFLPIVLPPPPPPPSAPHMLLHGHAWSGEMQLHSRPSAVRALTFAVGLCVSLPTAPTSLHPHLLPVILDPAPTAPEQVLGRLAPALVLAAPDTFLPPFLRHLHTASAPPRPWVAAASLELSRALPDPLPLAPALAVAAARNPDAFASSLAALLARAPLPALLHLAEHDPSWRGAVSHAVDQAATARLRARGASPDSDFRALITIALHLPPSLLVPSVPSLVLWRRAAVIDDGPRAP